MNAWEGSSSNQSECQMLESASVRGEFKIYNLQKSEQNRAKKKME